MANNAGPTYVHKDARIVYLANPKTASISTSMALHMHAGFTTHRIHRQHHARLERSMGEGWIVCTTVRNHFDAFVSWYFHLNRQEQQPFSVTFLDDLVGERDKTNHYFPDPDRLWHYQAEFATHLLHFENLEAELNNVLALRGLSPVELPRENVSLSRKHRPYQDFHTPETRVWVEDRYGREMAELGYKWEE